VITAVAASEAAASVADKICLPNAAARWKKITKGPARQEAEDHKRVTEAEILLRIATDLNKNN